jgi:methyl-accepting chemotaxis protein
VLISGSARQVEIGVRLVGDTGRSLERIAGRVEQFSSVMTEVAASTQEQSAGLGQVNAAVSQMDEVMQQNAAMIEQSTAASHGLAQEANELAKLIDSFKIGEEAVDEAEEEEAPMAAGRRLDVLMEDEVA